MVDATFAAQPTAGGSAIDQEQVNTSPGGVVTSVLRQRVRLGGAVGSALSDIVNAVGGAASALGHVLVGGTNERVDAQITQASTLGAAVASGVTGVEGNAGSQVILTPRMNHSSWTIQVTGAWAGTIVTEVTTAVDPTSAAAYWIPVNSRQSAGGRLANNFTVSGLFRGAFGGLTGVRARATALTSGQPNVSILTGQNAAVFQNSDVLSQTEQQYYASSAGLNTMWGLHSQEVALANGTAEQPVCIVTNTDPVGGRVGNVWRISKGSSQSAKWRRYRSTNMARTSGGVLIAPVNRGLGGAVDGVGRASALTMYAGLNLVVANQPAAYEKTVWNSGADNDTTTEDSSILIPPGQSVLFTASQPANGTLVALEFVYWDGSTLT